MAVIGYYLSGDDNDSFFLDNGETPIAPNCSKCGFLVDPTTYFNPFFKVKRKNLDFSFTYEQRKIVSLRFKEFCIREGYKGLVFKEFEREANYFQFLANNMIEVDVERSNPRFENYCEVCGNYGGIYLRELYLKNCNEELQDGFYRTDLFFSGGNSKQPIFVISPKTYTKLKKEKIKGIAFRAISI
jgi:hypothetical protein